MTQPAPSPEQTEKNRRVETLIMGESLRAETDDDRYAAVLEWLCDCEHDADIEPMFFHILDYWYQRSAHPWQQELEQHVANWRKPPRDFCNSIDLCVNVMQSRLREMGLGYEFGVQCAAPVRPLVTWGYMLNLSAEARVDAALAAVECGKGGGA